MNTMQLVKFLFVFSITTVVAKSKTSEICKREKWDERWNIICRNLTTKADIVKTAEFINNHTDAEYISMGFGNTAMLPVNIFAASTEIEEIGFIYFEMESIPYDFINPVCANLKVFRIVLSVINDGIIPAGMFKNCERLETLEIYGSNIRQIMPNAFQGLNNLKKLYLDNNDLTSLVNGSFRGLDKLAVLRIQYNKLETIEEGTFDPFSDTIQEVAMSVNPIRCNCSLQWLQDWIIEQKSKKHNFITGFTNLTCGKAMPGEFTTLNFCNTTEATNWTQTQLTTTAEPQQPPSGQCEPEDLVAELSKLLTSLLDDVACNRQKYTDNDIILKLKSVLDLKRSIMLFQSKHENKH